MLSQTSSLHQEEALGSSESFLEFQEKLSRVAPVDRPVLLVGERGTGKELAANRLHFLSRRWDGPLVTLNCSTLTPSLIESELFGHERGAFTGADKERVGRFEAAHGGTLFLDEIGTIPIEAQEKILRVVEYNSFERVGSSKSIEVDVRIVCATNIDLPAMAECGDFKRDLLDRLSFEVLFLPPLRIRAGDVRLLAEHFGARMAYELGMDDGIKFSNKAMEDLEQHSWQGNVRELKNVVERAVYKAEGYEIDSIDFNPFESPYQYIVSDIKREDENTDIINKKESYLEGIRDYTGGGFKASVESFEIGLIRKALAKSRYNQRKAAQLLRLTYDQFRGLYRKYRNDLEGTDSESLRTERAG